jgi:hypothetical protein
MQEAGSAQQSILREFLKKIKESQGKEKKDILESLQALSLVCLSVLSVVLCCLSVCLSVYVYVLRFVLFSTRLSVCVGV